MASFNRVTLIGNLTRDPQIKTLPGGNTTVAEFGLALNRHYRTAAGEDRDEVCFVDCAAFGKQADVINQYCKKGKQLFVEGRLKYDTWDDKAGNGKRSKLSVVVENFQFLGHREDGAGAPQRNALPFESNAPTKAHGTPVGAASSTATAAAPASPRGRRSRQPAEQPFGDEVRFKEADIPF